MRYILTIALAAFFAAPSFAAFVRQATETYPGGGGADTNSVKSIIDAEVGGTNTLVHTPQITNFVTKAVTNNLASEVWVTAKGYATDEYVDLKTGEATALARNATNRIGIVEAYMGGQNVRVSVTNYYAASSGELPRLRIEENVSNSWTIVWDENDKFEGFRTNTLNGVAAMTNATIAIINETKSPMAWGAVTSAGSPAPDNTVWHTAGKTVFGGGTEFKCVTTANGIFGALCNVGGVVYAQGNPGTFRFETEDFRYFFGMRVEDSYMLGCNTDGIQATTVGSNTTVQLSYDITMSGKPILYCRSTLEHFATNHWERLNDSTGTPIPGAPLVVSWDMSPPSGKEMCYINCGTNEQVFFTAAVEVSGINTFETNLEADFHAGILATNEVLHMKQAIEPYIDDVAGTVKWRVRP